MTLLAIGLVVIVGGFVRWRWRRRHEQDLGVVSSHQQVRDDNGRPQPWRER
jgi:hypothetical protein